MAIDAFDTQVNHLITDHLAPQTRYRSMLFQSNDLSLLRSISSLLCTKSMEVEHNLMPVDGLDLLGDECDQSCKSILEKIKDMSENIAIVIEGPLHFLDYWSVNVQSSFWAQLSEYSSGEGLIILDTFRSVGINDLFVAEGNIAGSHIQYLKSRLFATEVQY